MTDREKEQLMAGLQLRYEILSRVNEDDRDQFYFAEQDLERDITRAYSRYWQTVEELTGTCESDFMALPFDPART